jgi:EAL domain-containing protein (putative c-di-GMP-specific phosphodiesterase class I)
VEFQRDDFCIKVARVLEETGLESSLLELELTESMVMRNAPMTITKLNQLRELGVRIALDDFGTGFFSLSYLKLFSIDTLKIDHSFIQDIALDSKDTAITKTMIALARRLHLNVVAEGVETIEQLSFLRTRKCDEIQGYILSKPLPEEEITAFLKCDKQQNVAKLE